MSALGQTTAKAKPCTGDTADQGRETEMQTTNQATDSQIETMVENSLRDQLAGAEPKLFPHLSC